MSNLLTAVATTSPNLVHLLIGFLVLLVVLAIIAGLVWAVENWIHPIPPPVKLVLAIILIILVIIWAMQNFMGGT
jgi:hypothetical protein